MSEKEISEIQRMLYDILQRVTAVETKIDGYNHLREKLDKTYGIATNCRDELKEMKDNRKWLMRTSVGALITSTITLIVGMVVALWKL